jgi:hypothetical protein
MTPPNPVDNDDRDLTDWLVRTMRENAASSEVASIRALNTGGNVTAAAGVYTAATLALRVDECSALQAGGALGVAGGAQKALAYQRWAALVRDGARWDFKDAILLELGRSIRLCDIHKCHWYGYSVPGNIHYGYVGRAAGFTAVELHAGATYAQQTDPENVPWQNAWHGDQPGDFRAIEMGIQLYRDCPSLIPSCFQTVLWQYRFRLAQGWRPDAPYNSVQFGTAYPVTHFDGTG